MPVAEAKNMPKRGTSVFPLYMQVFVGISQFVFTLLAKEHSQSHQAYLGNPSPCSLCIISYAIISLSL